MWETGGQALIWKCDKLTCIKLEKQTNKVAALVGLAVLLFFGGFFPFHPALVQMRPTALKDVFTPFYSSFYPSLLYISFLLWFTLVDVWPTFSDCCSALPSLLYRENTHSHAELLNQPPTSTTIPLQSLSTSPGGRVAPVGPDFSGRAPWSSGVH